VKILKSKTFLAALFFLAVIYFSPPSLLNRPKFLILNIIKFPLNLTNNISYNINYLLNSKQLIQENLSLRKAVDMLSCQIIRYKEQEAENVRLKALLDFKQKSSLRLVAARVIGKDSTNLSDTLLIDKGQSDGIKNNSVVIAEAGLIGRVLSSASGISRVLLITDPDCRVSATVLRSRQLGMVYGISGRLCKLRYLPLDADIAVGDEVVTSGFSSIYPKGILIGKVIKIAKEPRGLSISALVKPAVGISRLEEVLCILE
jgi:rod shape-determining protein MreC